jgi:hypothetical protein
MFEGGRWGWGGLSEIYVQLRLSRSIGDGISWVVRRCGETSAKRCGNGCTLSMAQILMSKEFIEGLSS